MIITDKPEWRYAPEWANYLTMDQSGGWKWHEEKPEFDRSYWKSDGLIYDAFIYSEDMSTVIEEKPE